MEPRRAVIDLLQKHGQAELVVDIRFDTMKQATELLQDYSFNIDKKICETKGGGKVGNYVCVDSGCNWNVHVSRRPGSTRHLPTFVAAIVTDKQMSFKSLALFLHQKYRLNVQKQRSTLYRARDATAEDLAPSWSESFSYIAPSLKNFQPLNWGSRASVDVDKEARFMRAFVGIGTAIRATRSSMRLLGFDGTHSKNPKYSGRVLTLIGVDGNGATITIAFAVVHRENKANISWFFQQSS